MVKIIAFNGTMGVGKSTAIQLLQDMVFFAQQRDLPQDVKLIKFAAPIYDMQEYIYRRISDAYTRPPSFIKDRKLLQWLGTEFGRDSIDKDLWINIWKAEAKKYVNDKTLIVCDDCRFDNEAQAIKSLGGIIVKITSNRASERIDTASGIAHHKSESGIDDKYVDYIIENNDNIEVYKEKLCTLYNKLFAKQN